VDVFDGAVQQAQRGAAARHHQRHLKGVGDWIDDAAERIPLQPDLDVGIRVAPQRLALELGRVVERFLDASLGRTRRGPGGTSATALNFEGFFVL
jgi:hypothetical protein